MANSRCAGHVAANADIIGDVFAGQGRGSRFTIEEDPSQTRFHRDRQA